MLVSPTEPAELRALGDTRMTPERYGCDVLWAARGVGLMGVQRKEFPGDFLSSLTDDRLAMQLTRMETLGVAALVLEGRGRWTTEGELLYRWSGIAWTRSQHRRYLASVMDRGVWVYETADLADTIELVGDLHAWSAKDRHDGTRKHKGSPRDGWGRLNSDEFRLHLIQELPEVGPELARRINETIGMPFRLAVTENELTQVYGIGAKRARRIVQAFEGATNA